MATSDFSQQMNDGLLHSPAAERNKGPILEILKKVVPAGPLFALEIGSGTGQHVAHFARHIPNITWQPTEIEQQSYLSIQNYVKKCNLHNLRSPAFVDATQPAECWADGKVPANSCDLLLVINVIHISPWTVTQGIFRGAKFYLKPGGLLIIYGPLKIHGLISPESNVQFDGMLRQQCVEWGLRDLDDLTQLSAVNSLELQSLLDMPSNNNIVAFVRKVTSPLIA